MRLLDVHNLHLAVPPNNRCLLNNVSLQIDSGDRIGLAGNTGSGKSSLLRALAWLDSRATGQVRLQGQRVDPHEFPAYRRRINLVAQQPTLIDGTVRENLSLAFRFQANSQTYDENIALDLFTQMGRPKSLLDQDAKRLSGGERQIVTIIRSLLLQPDLLLLDEPTASMDSTATHHLEAMLLRWVGESPRRAMVWVSHDPSQLERVSNRTWILQDGQVS